MPVNKKRTSTKVASLASHVLGDKNASEIQKKLAASALSQSKARKQTGIEMEDVAARVMRSSKYSDDTKTLAATVLSQSNKKR